MPAALFPGLADKEFIPDHIGPLAQEYGILLGRAEERISMGIPPGAIADRQFARIFAAASTASARSNGDWRTVTRPVPTFRELELAVTAELSPLGETPMSRSSAAPLRGTRAH